MSSQGLSMRAVEWVRSRNANPEVVANTIHEDTDLFATGILDSMAFVELIAFLEEATGSRIDLLDVDPEDFTTVRGLSRHLTGPSGRSVAGGGE